MQPSHVPRWIRGGGPSQECYGRESMMLIERIGSAITKSGSSFAIADFIEQSTIFRVHMQSARERVREGIDGSAARRGQLRPTYGTMHFVRSPSYPVR
jgi:hypothetical protein